MGGLLSKTSCSFGGSFGAFYWCIAYCWWKICGFDLMLTLGHVSDKSQLLHCLLHLPKLVKYTVTSILLLEVNFWLLVKDNLLFIGCLYMSTKAIKHSSFYHRLTFSSFSLSQARVTSYYWFDCNGLIVSVDLFNMPSSSLKHSASAFDMQSF